MTTSSNPQSLTVQFHLGAENTTFDAAPGEVISALKEKALKELRIAADPSIEYTLSLEGKDVENETQAVLQFGNRPDHKLRFQIKKRPKGGNA